MSRGYRLVILAAFGLVLIGANEGKVAPQSVSNTQAATKGNASSKATKAASHTVTVPETPEAEPKDAGCADRKDRRDSDLCAQWKAADAAFDGARVGERQTIIGWIGLVLGAITMGAAIMAAVYAKRAAIATEKTVALAEDATGGAVEALRIAELNADAAASQVEIAREAMIAQNRAWITYHATEITHLRGGFRCEREDGSIDVINDSISLHPSWMNDGRSPAINIRTYRDHKILNSGESPEPFEFEWTIGKPTNTTLGSGKVFAANPIVLTDEEFARFVAGRIRIAVYCRVEYRYVFAKPDEPYCISEATKIINFRGWNGTKADPTMRTVNIADVNFGDQNVST